jgi:hypothetical protein
MEKYDYFRTYILRTPLNSLSKIKTKELNLNFFKQDITFLKSIQLSSPSLYSEFLKTINSQCSKEEEEKCLISLSKYFLRSCTRCTPFGLFAGLGIGTISDSNEIVLNNMSDYRTHVRLDMNILCAFLQECEKQEQIRQQLTYYANNSMYSIGSKFRYVEYFYNQTNRVYKLSQIDNDNYINKILCIAKKGIKIEGLVKVLTDEDILENDAVDYIHCLIDNQILVSSLSPIISGIELGEFIINTFEKIDILDNSGLKKLKELICDLKKQNSISTLNIELLHNKAGSLIKELNVDFDKKHLLQVDLITDFKSNTIDNFVIESVIKGLKVLNKLSNNFVRMDLTNFKNAFFERFEATEVPLSQVVDLEFGMYPPDQLHLVKLLKV